MKNFFTLFTLLLSFAVTKAQFVDLPNTEFRTMLVQRYPTCFNAFQQLDTTCTIIRTEDSLEFHELGVASSTAIEMEGIQYFTSLKYLNCSNNYMDNFFIPILPASLKYLDFSFNAHYGPGSSTLPVLPNTLLYYNCAGNYYTTIIFPDSLRYLNCSVNWLTSLPALPVKLDTLICVGQSNTSTSILTALPQLPVTLKYLDCSGNALTGLPALPASLSYLNCSQQYYNTNPETIVHTLASLPALSASLTYLDCSGNKLTTLPTLPSALTYLNCNYNRYNDPFNPDIIIDTGISALPTLPANLQNIYCDFNQLTNLPELSLALKQLTCSYNYITALPDLPPSLTNLSLQQNQVSELPALPLTLAYLNCDLNNITCLPHLPASMGGQPNAINLIVDRYKILCLPNNIAGLRPGTTSQSGQVVPITIPLCSPVNNANGCAEYPVVSGYVYYDNNSNGSKDAGEVYRPNVKVQLSNGLSGFTDINGYYELSADIGSYTLSIDPPLYYNAVPSTINYNFTSYDTLATGLISLQPNASVDSATISIIPSLGARPGFDFYYIINYENVGTTTVSLNIIIKYDDTRLNYLNSSNPSVQNNGSNLSLTVPNVTPGQKANFTAFFTVKQNVLLGDTIFAKATITAGSSINADSTFSPIRGSFDPNDKQATPSLTSLQAASGNYIDYLIRFQNTGTDTAFNIIVTDTLNSMLQAGTLQMIEASHPCRITQNGNVIIFEFLNILLPDSNVNSIKSHGYIKFRVKPTTGLSNSSIDNTADIYFDYNSPVLTNTVSTGIAIDVVPLRLLSFKGLTQPGNTALLYWNTTNEGGTRSFVIEQSLNGRTFNSIGIVAAKGQSNNSYMQMVQLQETVTFYRLKLIDIDGRFSYSDVIRIAGIKIAGGFIVVTNPANGFLNLKTVNNFLHNTIASIINSSGAVVRKFSFITGRQTIDISTLSAGTYFIKSTLGVQKLIISR